MKWILAFSLLTALACAHKPATSTDQRTPAQSNVSVPAPGDITIWSLQDLARAEKFDVLNELFNNHNLALEKLPQGYAAGAATRVFGMGGLTGKGFEIITGKSWRGKIFFPSTNPRKSRGLNRIREGLLLSSGIVPMANFTTEVLDHDPLTGDVKNVVNLNYANPITPNKGYWQEKVLKSTAQVYDLMVPVQGKYGPVYIGKTWFGSYDAKGNFTPKCMGPGTNQEQNVGEQPCTDKDYKDRLIAWFFLDFNEEALKVQKAQYWDGSNEKILDPLPNVVD